MQAVTALSRKEADFYKSALHQLVQESPIATKPGAEMMRVLRKELIRSLDSAEFPEYGAVVGEFYKLVTDNLVAAAHRSAPQQFINSISNDYHVITDEEEYQFHNDDGLFDCDDDEEIETNSNSDTASSTTREADPKLHRREELKKKRREEEEMLIRDKKVMDEKGRPYHTLGPYPAPRLTVRAPTNTFPSRKALQHRTVVETPSSSSSSSSSRSDSDLDEISIHCRNAASRESHHTSSATTNSNSNDTTNDELTAHANSSSSSPGGSGAEVSGLKLSSSTEGGEAVNHLTTFIRPLSLDSLKKVSESAKAKVRSSSSHGEFVSQIVKTAVRLGCEKACVLMDKQKIIEDMTTHVQTGPLPSTASIDFLSTLPDNLKQSLGSVLGLPHDKPLVEDMWERMVAMGFLSVLTNLRLKPLKKIASELGIILPDSNSTEKFCEAIVFAAFPRERIRAKFSRSKLQKVRFTVPSESIYTKGDMGFISFQVNNISMLIKESERHYSPEFSFAQLKWSLLCMTNKESLALYLCQVGSVHCKFLITVVNQVNSDDSICNEGTQSFSALSQENDWGFNNVIKFADLLNPSQGFVTRENDSIVIEVGIVLVEPMKSTVPNKSSHVNNNTISNNNNRTNNNSNNNNDKKKKAGHKMDEATVRQLLEDERTENMRKKIKQEIVKTVREEERTRKELIQKSVVAYHHLAERLKNETKRVQKEMSDRERKEEQERQREMDKIKQAQQQCEDMKRRLRETKGEADELNQEKARLMKESKETKKTYEKLSNELKVLKNKVEGVRQKVAAQESTIALTRQRYDALVELESSTPTSSEDENDGINADISRLIDEMTVGM